MPKKPEPRISPNSRTPQTTGTGTPNSPAAGKIASAALMGAMMGMIPQGSPIRGGDAETQRMAKEKRGKGRGR